MPLATQAVGFDIYAVTNDRVIGNVTVQTRRGATDPIRHLLSLYACWDCCD